MKYFMKNIVGSLTCLSLACFLIISIFGNQVRASNNSNNNDCPVLLEPILSGDEDVVISLLADGADANASLENCQFPFKILPDYEMYHGNYFSRQSTLLHIAAYYTDSPIYDILVDEGDADEETLDHQGLTPKQFKQEQEDRRARNRVLSRII